MAFSILAAICTALAPADMGALQVDNIRVALSTHAKTQPGALLSSRLPLLDSVSDVNSAYSAVREALRLTDESRPPLGNDLALAPIFESLAADGRADLPGLHTVSSAVEALDKLARWGQGNDRQSSAPQLSALAIGAAPPERLAARFSGAFERVEGTAGGPPLVRLSAEAFPALKARRSAVASAEARLAKAVKSVTASGDLIKYLAEADATPQLRDGRYVVPVQPQNKNLAGVEVGVSRSGRTCFVEPHALIRPSADARAARAALEACEAKLVAALCSLLLAHLADLCDAVDSAAELDSLLARAALSKAWQGAVPYVGDAGILSVRNARHPLLALQHMGHGEGANAAASNRAPAASPSRVLGNTLSLEAGARGAIGVGLVRRRGKPGHVADPKSSRPQGLLLTGPNGGGKSVVMKTAALYAVLVRLAVPLPCDAEGARVDFFDAVCTDLADVQSLDDGASSFAAHVRSCKRALEEAEAVRRSGGHSLVVLDEPGAATDATQGSALAQAVIETLLDEGSLVLAATHSDGLKTFGLAEPRLLTGAMARAADGTPLYTMLPGAVGSSHALDAAKREGLPDIIIERASQLLLDPSCAPGAGAEADECELTEETREEAKLRQMRQQSELLISALQERMAEADEVAEAARVRLADAEVARTQAKAAAAKAAASLAKAETYLQERTRSIDLLVARLRGQGGDDLKLLGETLRALRLAEVDARQSRENALAALGLQPIAVGKTFKAGVRLTFIEDGAGEMGTVDAKVVDDAGPTDTSIKVSINGGEGKYVPREQLATWFVDGGADDFSDMEAWGFAPGMGSATY